MHTPDARPRPRSAPDDLRAALAAGLEQGFEQVVLAFQDRLYAFALHLLQDRPEAEDVVQDAFVRAYRALQRYEAERIRSLDLRPWLYQITLNLARNRRRGKRVVQVSLDGDEGAAYEPEARQEERPEQRAEQAEQRREIGALLRALPEPYRAAVLLRHVHGLSYPECAQVLGQPLGTVKSHVHRGIALLRAALDQTPETARRAVVEMRR
jgi:RNA polymerase sigma-70 factor (ECF subfamily)